MGEGRGETFRSFGELKGHYDKQEQEAEQQELREIAELHDKVLGGKYDKVQAASFDLKQLGKYGKIMFGKMEGTQPGEGSVWVKLGYTRFDEKNQPKLSTIDGFISEKAGNGIVSARLPEGFPISREDLSKMVLNRIESMNVEKLHVTDFAAFEREVGESGRERGPKVEEEEKEQKAYITAERQKQFEILRSGKGFLYEAISKNVGVESKGKIKYPYNGYHAFVYRGGFVLEGPAEGHAAYAVKFDEPLEATEDPGTFEGREELFEQVRSRLDQAPRRRDLEEKFDAKRVIHKGEWQEKLQQHVTELSGEPEEREEAV